MPTVPPATTRFAVRILETPCGSSIMEGGEPGGLHARYERNVHDSEKTLETDGAVSQGREVRVSGPSSTDPGDQFRGLRHFGAPRTATDQRTGRISRAGLRPFSPYVTTSPPVRPECRFRRVGRPSWSETEELPVGRGPHAAPRF